ncbi:MAG: MerR family transcriptional regulator [Proteobacteria bacterium]|nr:MerR family transcriptional regulator [Pseudomonadota bacterium]NOG59976.1 MerR family transcriptional regulator [Pseudomonadota bacterium]
MSTPSQILETVFKIGAVSKITNIPVDTLRIWERRYSVVVPVRSKNADRLYKTEDINRLTLLKMLVDRGHSIGTIAHLSDNELSERLSVHDTNTTQKNNHSVNSANVVIVGEVLSIQIQHSQIDNNSFSFTGIYSNEHEFIENKKDHDIDILVVEYPVIHEQDIDRINTLFKESNAKQLILIYGFTNSAAKRILDKSNFKYIQAPISIDNLQREIIDLIKEHNINHVKENEVILEAKAPKRTYKSKQLIDLSTASSVIQCECPQHLSSMIIKLVQFEQYSYECIERYEKDAELHSILGNMAGHARSILEQALSKIVDAEGISLEQ